VLTTTNAAGTNGLTCLPKHGGARNSKFLSPTSLNFSERTLNALTSGLSSFLKPTLIKYYKLKQKIIRLGIDLVLIDQQSVKKRSLHLMEVRKRDGRQFISVNKFLKESHVVTSLAKERASFLKTNDSNNISLFGTPDSHHCCSIA
jgi:hypothetical protein